MDDFKINLKHRLKTLIKEESQFSIDGNKINPENITSINIIDPISIDDQNVIEFVGTCHYTDKSKPFGPNPIEKRFTGKAQIEYEIKLTDPKITLK